MDILWRLQRVTGEEDTDLLADLAETAKNAILSHRYPCSDWPTRDIVKTVTTTDAETGEDITVERVVGSETYIEPRYEDLQYRIALDLYNKIGAEGEISHSENGISRTYESSWISKQLLSEITPFVGVPQ